MTGRPTRMAVCGIDGSGKSSLISDLCETEAFRAARVFKKERRNHGDRLVRLNKDAASAVGAFATGSFALAQRWAYAIDFLSFVRNEVEAHWSGDAPVLLDRWTPCLIAWCRMLRTAKTEPIEAFAHRIPKPDTVVYLEVNPTEAWRRISARGNPKPDEALDVLIGFHAAYTEVLAELDVPVLRLPDLPRSIRLQRTLDFLQDVSLHSIGQRT